MALRASEPAPADPAPGEGRLGCGACMAVRTAAKETTGGVDGAPAVTLLGAEGPADTAETEPWPGAGAGKTEVLTIPNRPSSREVA